MKQLFLLSIYLVTTLTSQAQGEWKPLFNGKDLNNWKQLNGKAKYYVEGDAIVGESIPNTPNSFLTTKETYGDFILEYDVYLDTDINSGVQIRSLSTKDYNDGRVHGYQVELDPSSRGWTGGIYDEARRGWLYPLSRNPKAQSAFQFAKWNKIRVEAVGNSINTWVNGIQCARLIDDLTPAGFIALQVHATHDEDLYGSKIKWKNIRILTTDLKANAWNPDPEVPEISYLDNELTQYEKDKGWRLLFDGKTSNGWRGAKLDEFPASGWTIKDGILTIEGGDGRESAGPGDIVTTKFYSDFELQLAFKITKGANSGVKYFVDPSLNKGAGSAIGCEFQILDDEEHPDAKMGIAGNRTVGSLYDLITAKNLSEKGRSEKRFNGVDKWNYVRIVSKDGKVEHWLNNEKVVEYDRFSQMFRALVAGSKYAKWEKFGQWPEGTILLQDHGNKVSYKNIKINEL